MRVWIWSRNWELNAEIGQTEQWTWLWCASWYYDSNNWIFPSLFPRWLWFSQHHSAFIRIDPDILKELWLYGVPHLTYVTVMVLSLTGKIMQSIEAINYYGRFLVLGFYNFFNFCVLRNTIKYSENLQWVTENAS